MTTTNIGGHDIPDEVLAEAVTVADELDAFVPQMFALLDRAQWALSALELAGHENHRFDRPDDYWQTLERETADLRLHHHFDDLHDRTGSSERYTAELREMERAYRP